MMVSATNGHLEMFEEIGEMYMTKVLTYLDYKAGLSIIEKRNLKNK